MKLLTRASLALGLAAAVGAGLVLSSRGGSAPSLSLALFNGNAATATPIPPPSIVVAKTEVKQRTVIVTGSGTPGADIEYLNNRIAGINADGNYVAVLPLQPGMTALALEAVNRYGRMAVLVSVPDSAVAPGQAAALGKVSLTFLQSGVAAVLGKPPLQQRAEGIYLKLVLGAVNELNEPLTLQHWNFVLEDTQGRRYQPADQAEFAYGWDTEEGRLSGRSFPPGVKVKGWLIFDVAPSAKSLVLRAASDGAGPQWGAELALPDSALVEAK